LFRDLCQVTPDLSALHRMETDGAVYTFSLGDLARDREALFLAELAAPPWPRATIPRDRGTGGETVDGRPIAAAPAEAVVQTTGDLGSVSAAPAEVPEVVAAVHAYRAERRAQRALRRGQLGEATRHLRDTRQIVARLGHTELAAELEAQAAPWSRRASLGRGPEADQAETRRLGTRR